MKSRSFFKVSASTRTAALHEQAALPCAALYCAVLPTVLPPACTSELKLMSPMLQWPFHA